MNLEEMLHVFRTDEEKAKLLAMQIANDRGREVLECIFRERPKSASEIAHELGIPLPTVMFHVERFLEIGIIKVARTRMSRKLREIKYYGPAKRAILLIPYQKEETMDSIANAVKTSVITPLTVALAFVISGIAGFVIRRVLTPQAEFLYMTSEESLPVPMGKGPEVEYFTGFFSLQNPVILVLLGCLLTMFILGMYSYLRHR